MLLETNSGGTTQVAYTQTPDMYGELVSQRRSATSSFYHYDALGSTNELTDSSETETDTYRYYVFGIDLVSSGGTTNPFRYVGNLGYYDESDLGLQYIRARWYDPSTGRSISEDPAQDGENWYIYVAGNSINLMDPSGLFCIPTGWKTTRIAHRPVGAPDIEKSEAISIFDFGFNCLYTKITTQKWHDEYMRKVNWLCYSTCYRWYRNTTTETWSKDWTERLVQVKSYWGFGSWPLPFIILKCEQVKTILVLSPLGVSLAFLILG